MLSPEQATTFEEIAHEKNITNILQFRITNP